MATREEAKKQSERLIKKAKDDPNLGATRFVKQANIKNIK